MGTLAMPEDRRLLFLFTEAKRRLQISNWLNSLSRCTFLLRTDPNSSEGTFSCMVNLRGESKPAPGGEEPLALFYYFILILYWLVCMCVHTLARMCRGQSSMLGAFSVSSPPSVLSQSLSLNLQHPNMSRLTAQQFSGMLPSLNPQCCDSRYELYT